ncbi:MAG: hypoxanthine phosphoribosyltransferase [Planctomycetes bacterium]|nr:hypoxanthine phosphoribosyltransferase [Planctomycetota bacterium]
MKEDVDRVVATEEEIRQKVQEISRQLAGDYKGKDLTLIGILNGSLVFLSDVIRQLPFSMRLDTIGASTYGNSTSPKAETVLLSQLRVDIEGRDVLLVDDIIDTGKTLRKVVEDIKSCNPRTLKTCVLLNRKSRRSEDIEPDYTGFEIGDDFVVGYGLDYNNCYRNLPYIAVLKPECYTRR